jgi:hypothetical protein
MDAATDLAAVADRPTETTSTGDQDAVQADAPAKEVGASDAVAADTGSRDGTPIEAPRDVADVPFGCSASPTIPPACNDDPMSEAIQGVCQSGGTCLCNTGFVLNPSTGRCGYRRRDAAALDGTPTAAVCTGPYDACQCLCCSTDRRAPTCYFPTLGETVDEIRTTYEASKNPASCGPGSCSSVIVEYVCCMPAEPEAPSSATYVATGNVGGIDHLAIAKTGADCASLSFSGGAATKRAFNVDGGGYWTVSAGSVGPCGDAAAQTQIQGALGTLTLRKAGTDCVADLHATLFTIDNAGTVTTTRMDGDGIKMPSVLSVMSCP